MSPDFVALCAVAVVFMLDRFSLLDRFKRKTVAESAAELTIAGSTINRLRSERNGALETVKRLEQTRSLEPVLEQLHQNAQLQAQVLERLVHHNGAFKHMEESLHLIVEGMKALTGTIAELHDLPLTTPQQRQRQSRKTTF